MGNSESIHDNCEVGNEGYVKKYIAAGKDVNARDNVSSVLPRPCRCSSYISSLLYTEK